MTSYRVHSREHIPNDSKHQRRVHVDEQRRHFVRIMEDKTIPPSNDGTSQRSMGHTITRNPKCRARRGKPDVDKVENGGIIAKVEKEIVPVLLLVGEISPGEHIQYLHSIRDMKIPAAMRLSIGAGKIIIRERCVLWCATEQQRGKEQQIDAIEERNLFSHAHDLGRLPRARETDNTFGDLDPWGLGSIGGPREAGQL